MEFYPELLIEKFLKWRPFFTNKMNWNKDQFIKWVYWSLVQIIGWDILGLIRWDSNKSFFSSCLWKELKNQIETYKMYLKKNRIKKIKIINHNII